MKTIALYELIEYRVHWRGSTRWKLDTDIQNGTYAPPHWGVLRGAPKAEVGDAPQLYHAKYLQAIIASRAAQEWPGNSQIHSTNISPNWQNFQIPAIEFSTEESVRRSMTLNSMRMSTEYFESRSPRVLQLIENRLELGQRDVVHDALVYLANQLHDIHREMQEARILRADSVVAYLGLDETATRRFFHQRHLRARGLSWAIRNKRLGTLQRQIELRPLLESQLNLLRFELQKLQNREQVVLNLIDAVAARLYADSRD